MHTDNALILLKIVGDIQNVFYMLQYVSIPFNFVLHSVFLICFLYIVYLWRAVCYYLHCIWRLILGGVWYPFGHYTNEILEYSGKSGCYCQFVLYRNCALHSGLVKRWQVGRTSNAVIFIGSIVVKAGSYIEKFVFALSGKFNSERLWNTIGRNMVGYLGNCFYVAILYKRRSSSRRIIPTYIAIELYRTVPIYTLFCRLNIYTASSFL